MLANKPDSSAAFRDSIKNFGDASGVAKTGATNRANNGVAKSGGTSSAASKVAKTGADSSTDSFGARSAASKVAAREPTDRNARRVAKSGAASRVAASNANNKVAKSGASGRADSSTASKANKGVPNASFRTLNKVLGAASSAASGASFGANNARRLSEVANSFNANAGNNSSAGFNANSHLAKNKVDANRRASGGVLTGNANSGRDASKVDNAAKDRSLGNAKVNDGSSALSFANARDARLARSFNASRAANSLNGIPAGTNTSASLAKKGGFDAGLLIKLASLNLDNGVLGGGLAGAGNLGVKTKAGGRASRATSINAAREGSKLALRYFEKG